MENTSKTKEEKQNPTEHIAGLEFTILTCRAKTYYVLGKPNYQVMGLPIYFEYAGGPRLIALENHDPLLYRLRIRDLTPDKRKELKFDSAYWDVTADEIKELGEKINQGSWQLEHEIDMREEDKRHK